MTKTSAALQNIIQPRTLLRATGRVLKMGTTGVHRSLMTARPRKCQARSNGFPCIFLWERQRTLSIVGQDLNSGGLAISEFVP
jgi:hypothetical protein